MSEACICKTCGVEFQRRSPKGPKPTLCDEHRDPTRNKYRTTGEGKPLSKLEQQAEAARAAARVVKIEDEPSWLDDPEVQEQLVERQRAALGVDASASVIDQADPSPGAVGCSAPSCSTLPAYPMAEPKFCLNHWLAINHDVRGVLLGSEPGSSPWNGAVVKAIRSLR